MKPKSTLSLKQQLDINQEIVKVFYNAMKRIWIMTGKSDITDEELIRLIERISCEAMIDTFILDQRLKQTNER